MEADHGKRASTHRTHRVRHANERRRELPSKYYPCSIGITTTRGGPLSMTITMTDLEKLVRHYGLLKFLRRATLTSNGSGSSNSSIYSANHYAPALRTPGIPHAYLRSGHGGRGRRAPDFMRGVPRADLHTPRGVRRPTLCARGLLGGVQFARARAGTEGLARR